MKFSILWSGMERCNNRLPLSEVAGAGLPLSEPLIAAAGLLKRED